MLVRWIGLDDEGASLEPVPQVLEDAPGVWKKKLTRLRLSSDDKKQLREHFGFSV